MTDFLLLLQGDKADCFYIVESGEVKILIRSKVTTFFLKHIYVQSLKDKQLFNLMFPCLLQTKAGRRENTEVEVARCSKGQYFGELALVTNKPRAASAYAVGETKCLGMLNTHHLFYHSVPMDLDQTG